MNRRLCLSVLLLAAALAAPALAADPPACVSGTEWHQFDFWIGEWEVTADGKHAGTNTIQPILDGCVLQETWSGAQGGAGTSLNFYDPARKAWRQLWVWRGGSTLELEGGLVDGRMVLRGDSTDREGKAVANRITWSANPDGSVRQHWETSSDGGATWQSTFDGLYRRRS